MEPVGLALWTQFGQSQLPPGSPIAVSWGLWCRKVGKCRFKKLRGNVIETMEAIHGLATKDFVKYTKGEKAGLEGLTDGGTYYVRRVAANQFQVFKAAMDAEAGEKAIECRGGSETNLFTKL
mmetsp:Transcript_26771/g.69294  ORF Transcript_26771/g.69294 Transcript_26771/m.69294 type:complete len:122 (-) Transcript_26771:294-659(-)